MNAIQQHRGPDDSGVFRARAADLAMAAGRLAIVDIAGGHQPLTSDDGRYTLVYNGEIYNAPELRRALESRGEVFATAHSDTELVLRALMRDGRASLSRLNGMFALALYDREAGEILCARDRLGIKPLYYTDQAGRFAFASELKSLLTLPFVARNVDRQSLFHYLSLMYVPGEESIIAGVRRLPPGCSLTWRIADRTPCVERWWRPEHRPDETIGVDDWSKRVRETLAAAVGRWSIADVPIACSLSGGIDSASIVGSLAERGARVETFSLGFTGPAEEAWNELPLARAVARRWGTRHHELVLDARRLLDDLPDMVWHLDEPYGGGLPSWLVFKRMSESFKVGLTGTGGDELFGNYGKWLALEESVAAASNDAVEFIGRATFRRAFFDHHYYLGDEDKRSLMVDGATGCTDTSDYLFERFAAAGGGVRDRVAVTDMTTQLPDEFLMMTDRLSMAHGLEARTPFLDNDMVDLALSIPASLRTDPDDLKGLLRRAVEPLLPAEILTAPKRGFVVPLGLWMRGPLRPLCEHLLSPRRLREQGFVAPAFHARYVGPHMEGTADHTSRVWSMLMFQMWHDTFIDRAAAAAPDS